jgi:NADH dehydrogenase
MTKNIVIVGGGFAGVKSALELCKEPTFSVTLVTKSSTFNYYPTLYKTATGGSRIISSMSLGEIFNGKPVNIIIDTATKVDRQKKQLLTESGRKLQYDELILGLGVVTNYFGIKGLEEFSKSMKSIDKAEALKAHLNAQIRDGGKPDLNYVVVGGGPTGVELAGALPHYIRHLFKKYRVAQRPIHVDLVEAQDRLLPVGPERVSRAVTKRLKKMGVKIMTGMAVQGETLDSIMVSGKPIKSHTVIWTAGVTNNPFFKENNFTIGEHGRVQVNEFLQAEPHIYVIGDNAATPFSGLAQTALRDAVAVANNLIRQAHNEGPVPYKPKRPIYVYPVGERWAAVVWGPVVFYGILGWLLRTAADWIGYHDLEPWWLATARTLGNTIQED